VKLEHRHAITADSEALAGLDRYAMPRANPCCQSCDLPERMIFKRSLRGMARDYAQIEQQVKRLNIKIE
jgi:hypothetical protein